jgi:hypothetical protein
MYNSMKNEGTSSNIVNIEQKWTGEKSRTMVLVGYDTALSDS